MGKRGRRTSAIWLLAAMVLVLIAAASATLLFASEPGLLDHATRLAATDTWAPGYGGYFWETDHSVLTFRPDGPTLRAVSKDFKTGAEIPLKTLSEDFRASQASGPAQWRLSPDGKFLVWRIDNVGPARWIVSDLAGRRVKIWKPSYGAFDPLWLPSNRQWMEHTNVQDGLVPILHSMDGPDVRCTPITGPFTWPLGITPDSRVVTFEWHPESSNIVWYEYPLSPEPKPSVRHSVLMPKSADNLIEAELSPEGDRIACLVHYTYSSTLERLIARLLPSYQLQPHQKVGLWIIRRDGSRARLLGAEDGSQASSLLWTPDGKRVTFCDHESLYAVPASGD